MIKQNLPDIVITACQCRDLQILTSKPLIESISTQCRQNASTFKKSVSTCVIFLPTELNLIPEALVYEMFRCCGVDCQTRDYVTWRLEIM